MAFETEGFSTPVEMFLKGQQKFLREVAKVEKRLDKIAKKKITPTIGKAFARDASKTLGKVRELQASLDKLGRTNVQPKINLGGGVFSRQERLAGGLIKRLAGLAVAYVGVRQAIAAIGSSVRVFTILEDNLLATKAVTQATEAQFGALSDQARELGRTTVKTAGESAKAQTLLARAGFSVNEVLATVPALIDLSTAGQLDLASATSITANILRAFDKDVNQVGRVMDVLALASSRANTTIGGIGEGAKFASPIFAALKLRIEEMAAAQAVLADRGQDASLGGTGLRISMQSLISPTEEAKKVLKSMGVALEDVDLKGETLVQVVELLASKNLSAAQAFEIFSARGGTAMLNLTAGVKKFGTLTTDLLTKADGTVKRMADTMQEGLGGSTRRLISATEAAQIAFADGFTPSLIESQQAMVELLNSNQELLQSLGRLSGEGLNVLSKALGFVVENLDVLGGVLNVLANDSIDKSDRAISRMTKSTSEFAAEWKNLTGIVSSATLEEEMAKLEKKLKGIDTEIKSTRQTFSFLGKEVGNTKEETEQYVQKLGLLGGSQLAVRQQLELLISKQEEINETETRAAEIADEHTKAVEREEIAAKKLADKVRALAKVEREAESVTKKFTTAEEKLTAELVEAEKLFSLGAISVTTYERAVKSLGDQLDDLAIKELRVQIKSFQQQIELTQPDIQARVVVDDSELDTLIDEIDDLTVIIRAEVAGSGASGVPIGNETVTIGSGGVNVADALLPSSAEIAQFGKEYKAQLTKAQKLANLFEGKWDDIANAGIRAADLIGGSFGEMIAGLIGGIDGIAQGFDQIKAGEALGGAAGAAQQFGGSVQTGQSVFNLGASLGIFDVDKDVSQFGAAHSGDFEEEGAAAGAVAGAIIAGAFTGGIGAPVGALIGSIIGGLLGTFVKKGADEGLLQLKQDGDDIIAVVTKNQGGLGDILAGVGQMFTNIIDNLETTLGADIILGGLDRISGGLGISGEGVSLSFKIRDDFIRVFINDLEKDFKTIEEALQFAVVESLKSATFGAGLGEEVRKVLESGAFTTVEDLDIGIAVAQVLDTGVLGANQYTAALQQLDAEHREITKVVRQFGLDQRKANQVYSDRLALIKQDISLSLSAALGVQDRLSFAKQQEQAVNALNSALATNLSRQQSELEMLRQREDALITGGVAAQQAIDDVGGLQVVLKEAREDFISLGRDGIGSVESGSRELLDTLQRADTGLASTRDRIEILELQLANIPESVDTQAIADAFNLAGRQSGQDLIAILQEINGQGFLNAEQDKLINLSKQAQLASQLASTQLLLASTTVLDATVRQVLETLLVKGQETLAGLVAGTITVGGQGAGRGKQRREQAARAAEEAARKLDDFNDSLQRLELNASTASGQLGDLASRIAGIVDEGIAALQFGATPEDVQRQQQLQLSGEKQDLLAPFDETKGIFDNFFTESADIEQLRQDAIEQAKLLAQAQADLLGIPFEQAFASMESTIEAGARRMQNALTRGVVNAFGLPLEQSRNKVNDFVKKLKDLQQAFASGAINGARYRDLIDQIQAAQAQALGGSVLSLTDKYYEDVVGGEELRRELAIANFELELAQTELTFRRLEAEGALAEDMVARIGGLVDFMRDNPPDWDAFFADGPSGGGQFGGGGSSTSAIAVVQADFSTLLDAINDFIGGFNKVDIGRFESQARDWVGAIEGFNNDIEDALAESGPGQDLLRVLSESMFGISDITELTVAQLEELSTRLDFFNNDPDAQEPARDLIDLVLAQRELGEVSGQAAGKLLGLFRGTIESTSALAAEYATIGSEFEDIAIALQLVGGSAEQLVEAESIRQERLLAFWDSALSRTKELAESIRGGQFGGVSSVSVVTNARTTLDDLVARLAADPLDFEALEQLDAAQVAFLEAQKEFTGGVGPQFAAAIDKVLAISDSLQAVVMPAVEPLPPPPEILLKMDDQTTVMQQQTDLMGEMITITNSRMTQVEEQHAEILAKMDEAIISNVDVTEATGSGLVPPS